MFGNSFKGTTPATEVPMAEEVEQLRQDPTKTAAEIIDGVLNNFYTAIENINQRLNTENAAPQVYERFETPRPLLGNQDSGDSSTNTDSDFDLDRDVIMKSKISAPLNQVPEPGFFLGKTSETELLCQLSEDTFRTTPNKYFPEETKINFVKSRLRDSERNWYLTK
ncbi:hypothetical protein BCR32DRAFT_304546 [Anaeromyces robustus]|uniref:Uncharacterized protein n=1 Tax=Anaeromyces robustus TaxID=1754192 RepID=A0A1Y1XIE4_9FUNG|nr:hypothetical protein BCR32DRAFT_304546 [Anaeromyces robustus]|eukprot:ORX85530.1 hypothetical protein BCR32DRAFT_304546 [Anaeromyces robustus]